MGHGDGCDCVGCEFSRARGGRVRPSRPESHAMQDVSVQRHRALAKRVGERAARLALLTGLPGEEVRELLRLGRTEADIRALAPGKEDR